MQFQNVRMQKIFVLEIFRTVPPRTKIRSYEQFLNENFADEKKQITVCEAFFGEELAY